MPISVGDTLPDATLLHMGEKGVETVSLASRLRGRNVILFALPGAYTGVCTTAHVPSFVRTARKLADKGVDEVICLSVNDPFVLKVWGEATGATAAGISMLADADAAFTKAVGMDFSAPPVGLIDRSKRYALYAVDGVVKVFHGEPNPGTCDMSGGEAMLAAI